MELELLVPMLAAVCCATAVWLFAAVLLVRSPASPLREERHAWNRLVLPLVPGAGAFAFLAGWAAQEPNPADERLTGFWLVPVAFVLVVVTRAAVRSVRSLREARHDPILVGTIGILRPRVTMAPAFKNAVTREVAAAALAHEYAHLRARDPFRVWLGQLACDLQWPIPGAERRLREWLLSLEIERDQEAVSMGASPIDLAEAILVAARLECAGRPRLAAQISGAGDGIAIRVRRLMQFTDRVPRKRLSAGPWRMMILATLAVCAWAGLELGETILCLMPGVWR
jgi:hypothetical protein